MTNSTESEKTELETGKEQKLFDMVKELKIVEGHVSSDTSVWEFHVVEKTTGIEKVLKIDYKELDTMGSFGRAYRKAFRRLLFKINTEGWLNVLDALSDPRCGKVKVVTNKDESKKVYNARMLFELIREIQPDSDKESAFAGNSLYDKGDGYYWLPSFRVSSIIKDAGIPITADELSPVMFELGYKKEGNDHIRYGKCGQKRSWGFNPVMWLDNDTEEENEENV